MFHLVMWCTTSDDNKHLWRLGKWTWCLLCLWLTGWITQLNVSPIPTINFHPDGLSISVKISVYPQDSKNYKWISSELKWAMSRPHKWARSQPHKWARSRPHKWARSRPHKWAMSWPHKWAMSWPHKWAYSFNSCIICTMDGHVSIWVKVRHVSIGLVGKHVGALWMKWLTPPPRLFVMATCTNRVQFWTSSPMLDLSWMWR